MRKCGYDRGNFLSANSKPPKCIHDSMVIQLWRLRYFFYNINLEVFVKRDAVKRTDLSVTDEEFETVWVEIKNNKSESILCCCAYRHPSSSPERFTEHIETILHINLGRENKNIFLLGDFNINLLNCANHPASENFLNMLNSNYLLPYFLQPTRVTDSGASLIDNIFANTFNFNALNIVEI